MGNGQIVRVENDRREDPQPEAVSPQSDAASYREAEERREDYAGEEQPREQYRDDAPDQGGESAAFDSEGRQTVEGGEGAPTSEQQPAGAPGGQSPLDRDRGGRGRGGRRGGRRMSQRERRQDRNRRRDHRPSFSGSHQGGGYQQHGGSHSSHLRDQGGEAVRESQPRQEGSGSILNDIRAEVERLREVLEGVLRDLEDVSEQLIKAEHEKDLAEAEIEQLREQLRRLHR